MDKYSFGLCVMWFIFHDHGSCPEEHTASRWIKDKRTRGADMLATATTLVTDAQGILGKDREKLQSFFSECLSDQDARFQRVVASKKALNSGELSTADHSADERFFMQTQNNMISVS